MNNYSSNYRKQGPGTQRVQQVSDRDGDKLSPVDFNIRDAISIQLPPLQWVHYNVTPSNVTVRNTGFTLMINAAFNQQSPYVCAGPLTGDYVFAQIHFHWGEHDATGSGHAIDGMRYPLEMHVVHLKRDCANLGEAFSKKDGIAVMVHMFALREERNTNLDQLTAILQFIHKPKCCARLYPTPLAEIVQPFTSDYFLYWGAVGSPRGQYRILWFLSRDVLPISAQQLGEFRQLCNSQGQALVSNANKPYPLAERSMFLVSPSDRINETMCGISQWQRQHTMTVDSEDSIDLRDAEYKSLADLDETNDESDDTDDNCYRKQCRVCPVPRRLQQTANINVGYPCKVNEGDTSVEESCVDLDSDPGVTVKTETKYKENTKGQKVITNVNVTTFRPQKYRIDPSDAVYSVVSSRGSELHLRRKPAIVRPSEPSREQACMLLSRTSSTYQTFSAPSLTSTAGYIPSKRIKSTNISSQPIKHMSSEIAVHYRDSEMLESRDQSDKQKCFKNRTPNPLDNKEDYENNNLDDRLRSTNYNNRVVVQELANSSNPCKDQRGQTPTYRTYVNDNENRKQPARPTDKKCDQNDVYMEDVQDSSFSEENSKYIFFKRYEKKKTVSNDEKISRLGHDNKLNSHGVNSVTKDSEKQSSDIRQYIDKNNRKEIFNSNNDSNKTNLNRAEINRKDYVENSSSNKTEGFKQLSQEKLFSSSDYKEQIQKRVIFKEVRDVSVPPLSRPIEEDNDNETRVNKRCHNEKDGHGENPDRNSDAQYKVRLLVRTTISDHRKPGKKGKQFYVTKISPMDASSYITPKSSKANIEQRFGNDNDAGEYYYAKPISDKEQTIPGKGDKCSKNTHENEFCGKDISFTVNEYHERSSDECYNKEVRKRKEYVATSIMPKETVDQKPNSPPQTNPNYNTEPQVEHNIQNENEDDTYEYHEDHIKNEEYESKNETQYKKTKRIQPSQPQSGNKPIAEPKQITEVNPENKQLITNKSINTVVKFEESSTTKLVEQTHTYQCENDSDTRIVDKTVTGKIGETKSTDVFIKRRITEMVKPEKTDVSEEVDYSLVKSKHTEPQKNVEETLPKSQPRAVITQTLSIEQKIKGHSHVRQTVQYHDKKRNNKTEIASPAPVLNKEIVSPTKEINKQTNCPTEISEEESLEQSSTVKKSQHLIANNLPSSNQQERKRHPTDVRAVENDVQTTSNLKPLNKNNNFDQSTVLEKYTEEKSSKVIKSYQHQRTESNPNNYINKNKVVEGEPTRDIKQDIVNENVQNTKLTIPTVDANDPSSTQNNLTLVNEIDGSGSLSYEHEEIRAVNKSLKRRTKVEKVLIVKGKEIVSNANNVPIDRQDQNSSEYNKTNEVLEKKEDENKDQKITSKSEHDQSPNLYTNENNYEELTEESVSGYRSQKTKKTTIVQRKGDPSYKLPKQATVVASTPDTNHIIPIKKVEIPEPHYITRIPKQPLVEYEAYPVDPRQPFEIITETMEEISSTVKTNKTFMMFKKINGKAILNQPSVIEPMKMERNHTSEHQSSHLTSSKSIAKVQTGVEQSREVIESHKNQSVKPLQKEDNSGQITSTPKRTNYATNKDDEGGANDYDISETSITSLRETVHKEKRYRLAVRQPSVDKEDISVPKSCPRKPPFTSIEETSKNNVQANGQISAMETPEISDQTKVDSRFNKKPSDLNKKITDNRTKIVSPPQVSLIDKPHCAVNSEVVKVVNDRPDGSLKLPVKPEPISQRQRQGADEEFFEFTTKEEKYESSQRRYVSIRGNTRIVNARPSEVSDQCPKPQFLRYAGKDLTYPEDEPTRDFPVQEHKFDGRQEGFGRISESSSESQDDNKTIDQEKNSQKASNKLPASTGNRNPTILNQNNLVGSVPVNKTDGDIVIYIRQPRSKKEQVTPKITVDVTEKQLMSSSELDDQKVQVHEIKDNKNKNRGAPRNPIEPRKSKSAGNYTSFSSSDSNEEQVIDTTHYNLTLKSETQVELEGGKRGHVKSKNEVTITPLGSRPGSPSPAQAARRRMVGRPAEEDAESESRDDDEDDSDSSDSTTSYEEPVVASITGFNQSPIRINTQTTETINYPTLQFVNHWNASGDALLENNGKTLRGTYIQETAIPYIKGGPLSDDYVFSEVHFHWGYKDCCGAEHIIDGKRYAVEAHFLYFKKEYGLLKESLAHDDGLAIVAVNLTVGGPPNPQLGELLKDIRLLMEPNTGAYVPASSLFSWLKPAIHTSPGYYSYKGSLTLDPPAVEAVTWMVFPEPIVFCCQQSQEFRKLKSSKGAFLTKNFRPPQPLNNRIVYYVPS